MDLIVDVLADSVIDTIKLIPFLFVTYLAMEALEHFASNKVREALAHWTKRKLLLCSAVDSVFDFDDEEYGLLKNAVIIKCLPFIKDNAISDKCNSFSAIIYYIHLMGDQKARKSYKKNDLTMDFVLLIFYNILLLIQDSLAFYYCI